MSETQEEKVMARCMRCKEQKEVANGEEVVTANGMRRLKGNCKDCGCGMSKILGKA